MNYLVAIIIHNKDEKTSKITTRVIENENVRKKGDFLYSRPETFTKFKEILMCRNIGEYVGISLQGIYFHIRY